MSDALTPGATASAEIKTFAQAILHGDDEHRAWLTEAAECFVAGRPLPPPRGKGTQSAALAPPAVPEEVPLRDSIRREARELRALASDPEYIGAWAAFTVAADNLDALADPNLALLAAQPAGRVDEGSEARHRGEVELQEIADGAYGDNPMVRGAARDRLQALARSIAAEKIGSVDPTGLRLPDDIWRQALPEAERRLEEKAYIEQRRDFYINEAQRLALLVRKLGGDPEPGAPAPAPAPDSGRGTAEDAVEAVAGALWRSDNLGKEGPSWADWLDYVESHGSPPSLTKEIDACRRRARVALDAAPAPPGATGEEWRLRAADEIDGMADLWGRDGRGYAKTIAAILRSEHPAPPSAGEA